MNKAEDLDLTVREDFNAAYKDLAINDANKKKFISRTIAF
jgi:hypothetical protein